MANNNGSGKRQNLDQDNQQRSQSSGLNQDLDIINRSQERVGGAPNATGPGETSRSLSGDDDLGTEDINTDVPATDDVNDRGGNYL